MAEQIFLWTILIVGGFFLGFGLTYWMGARAAPYPFDDPAFVHVGLTPVQLAALKPLALALAFMERIPCHDNRSIEVSYYAMTRPQFLKFCDELSRHVKIKVAEAAKRQDSFLSGDVHTLSLLMIGLAPILENIANNEPIDSVPA